jgi:hypothetical protein
MEAGENIKIFSLKVLVTSGTNRAVRMIIGSKEVMTYLDVQKRKTFASFLTNAVPV